MCCYPTCLWTPLMNPLWRHFNLSVSASTENQKLKDFIILPGSISFKQCFIGFSYAYIFSTAHKKWGNDKQFGMELSAAALGLRDGAVNQDVPDLNLMCAMKSQHSSGLIFQTRLPSCNTGTMILTLQVSCKDQIIHVKWQLRKLYADMGNPILTHTGIRRRAGISCSTTQSKGAIQDCPSANACCLHQPRAFANVL